MRVGDLVYYVEQRVVELQHIRLLTSGKKVWSLWDESGQSGTVAQGEAWHCGV